MSRKDKMFCEVQMELKWLVSIYHFTVFFFVHCFRLFHDFSLKSLPAARKGMKRRKREFSRVSVSEFKNGSLKKSGAKLEMKIFNPLFFTCGGRLPEGMNKNNNIRVSKRIVAMVTAIDYARLRPMF